VNVPRIIGSGKVKKRQRKGSEKAVKVYETAVKGQ
jgi:hypothetical protein